jgi:chitin disaccharide deacetylase
VSGGLLIVNADDWGGSEATTEAILRSFEAGRVTSTSGMVYMPDSDRAAEVAKRKGLPVGLHLNLTEPFADPATPPAVRHRQRRVAELFSGRGRDGHPGTARLRKWVYDPRIRTEVGRAIADQIERFEALYGRPPTHFDGHNYVDVCPNVFLSGAIPGGSKMRNSLDRFPLERSAMGVLRSIRQALRSRRFASTRYLLHIAELHLPEDGPADLRLALAQRRSVEVMGHPDDERERAILMSAAWGRVLAEHRLGSFADLRPDRLG